MTSRNEQILLSFYPKNYRGHLVLADALLEYFPNQKGTLVEVGAAHPELFSSSAPLRRLGWNVISVEPNPEFCADFKTLGLPVLQYAATDKDVGTTTFKISPNLVSCSSLGVVYDYQNWTDANFQTINVEALTLNTILKKHHPQLEKIDAMIVDTEGWEREVLMGLDLGKYSPKVICLENFKKLPEYRSFMADRGYKLDKEIEQDEFYSKV